MGGDFIGLSHVQSSSQHRAVFQHLFERWRRHQEVLFGGVGFSHQSQLLQQGVKVYRPANAERIWGKNPADTLHHVSNRIMQAVEGGARLMVINPARIDEVAKADLWLKPRPGSDLALALGMINVIINEKRQYFEF